MKRIGKIITAVCMALILAVQTAFPAYANSRDIDGIFNYFTSGGGFYEELAFGENDWAAYCRIRLYGTDGAGEYLRRVQVSAEELMQSDGFVKPTELQRAAIVLSAAGMCSESFINAAVYNNDKLERQGMNAYIWALTAANCCDIPEPQNALNTKASLAEYLVSKQLPDGGFALKGEAADTDITAAVIYALAPLNEDEAVAKALERAEQCLRSLQLPSGGFASMGTENCESAAQAIIAFCALGYDEGDEEVSKALSALMKYRTADGSFSHIGGEASGISTVQGLQALTALELSARGESLFCASTKGETNTESAESVPTAEASGSTAEQPADTESTEATSGGDIRVILAAASAAAGAALIVVWLARGRKRALLIAAGGVMIALAAVIMLSDIRTPEEYYADSGSSEGIVITVSADCTEALEYPEKAGRALSLPEDGYVITPAEITLPEGSTAFDALIAASKEQKISVDHTSSAMGTYVSGIGVLYEFDYGSESGWLYYVNGKKPAVSSSAYRLNDGDEVCFTYTTHLSY